MNYTWDNKTNADVTLVAVTNSKRFIAQITDFLPEGYSFITAAAAKAGAPKTKSNGLRINNNLLGSIAEFCVFVICKEQFGLSFPFIGCFRAPDPLGSANFPLVDVRMLFLKQNPKHDILCLQEIKTTRFSPDYFKETLVDYDGLFSKSRLYSTAEHLKADLRNARRDDELRRVNDCLGTYPGDSNKIELFPTGVCDSSCSDSKCVSVLQSIVKKLKSNGWANVEAMLLTIVDIDRSFLSFAIGEGDK